jgi:hypothetical protein
MTQSADTPVGAESMDSVDFEAVLVAEHQAIRARREQLTILRRGPLLVSRPGDQLDDLTGVALSGGGVRSAAFCLGALQALDASLFGGVKSGIDGIDYLSTVSGGGYIGSSLSAAMYDGQEFPFRSRRDYADTWAVAHLRDYSNYLLPRGRDTFLAAIAVVLRGLATNIVLVLAVILFCASVTIYAFPNRDVLPASFVVQLFHRTACTPAIPSIWQSFLACDGPPGAARAFFFTLLLIGILAIVLVLWALDRSLRAAPGSEVGGQAVRFASLLLLLLLVSAALDLHPVILRWFFDLQASRNGGFAGTLVQAWKDAGVALAPLAGVAAFLSSKFAKFLKKTSASGKIGVLSRRILALGALWFAALTLPILLWLVFLRIALAGIAVSGKGPTYPFAFHWLAMPTVLGHHVSFCLACFVASVLLMLIGSRFSPNANSLHRLYQDKLGKAFLFDPSKRVQENASWFRDAKSEGLKVTRTLSQNEVEDLAPRDTLLLREISPRCGGPYQLINATLNLQGSKKANRRGRNADFFLFSANHVGSDVTRYVKTSAMETKDPNLNLAAAMAISGAAISSNMGSASIPQLSPTLALLNMRLGYWMRNPVALGQQRLGNTLLDLSKLYLLSEMFGLLDETARYVYLTDGGHIENLGLYQLLKRRCKVIVLVDAEEDSQLAFAAFATAQRYARIDLGVTIDCPWREIAAATKRVSAQMAIAGCADSNHGPHCALGNIYYSDGSKGLLLYVKASLSGDESDYIMKYKREHPEFPFESTGDQFFTEEQFEAYRALGFHALNRFLTDANEEFGFSTQLGGNGVTAKGNFLQHFSPQYGAVAPKTIP